MGNIAKLKKFFSYRKNQRIILGRPGKGKEYKDGHTIINIIDNDYSFETTIKGLSEIYGVKKANIIIQNPTKIYKFYPFDENLI